MNSYLSEQGLKKLSEYKYHGTFAAFIDRCILNPTADKIAQHLPRWLAPNLITLTSLSLTFLSFFLVNLYSPDLKSHCPSWVYAVVGWNMIIYAILDCVDGKQARRTGSSSPLGQLFDHGCDSITCALHGIMLAVPMQVGGTLFATLVFLVHIIPFYFANWEQGVTTLMRFGILGVTEGQLTISLVFIITAITGPQIWGLSVNILSGSLLQFIGRQPLVHEIMLILAACVVVFQIISSIREVSNWYRDNGGGSGMKSYIRLVSFFIFVVLSCAWIHSPSKAFAKDPRVILLCVGFLFCYQAIWIIVCAVTDEPYPFFFKILWPLPLFTFNAWTNLINADQTLLLAHVYLGLILLSLIHYIVCCINQITTYLGIRVFVIKPKPVEKSN